MKPELATCSKPWGKGNPEQQPEFSGLVMPRSAWEQALENFNALDYLQLSSFLTQLCLYF